VHSGACPEKDKISEYRFLSAREGFFKKWGHGKKRPSVMAFEHGDQRSVCKGKNFIN
jgi:hypothetical protein